MGSNTSENKVLLATALLLLILQKYFIFDDKTNLVYNEKLSKIKSGHSKFTIRVEITDSLVRCEVLNFHSACICSVSNVYVGNVRIGFLSSSITILLNNSCKIPRTRSFICFRHKLYNRPKEMQLRETMISRKFG